MGSKNKNKTKSPSATAGATATATAGGGDENNRKRVITDPRFSKVQNDPRFQKAPRHKAKVTIDSRFSSMFEDKRFAPSTAPFDKRGKPKKRSENSLRRYYHLEDDDDDDESKAVVEKEATHADSSPSESDDSRSVASSSTTDTDEDEVEMSGDEDEVVENVPCIENETHRLAVVNMDWSQVKAVDVFMMLKLSLPNGGEIKSVTVYPSEFGLKRMEEEAVRGPVGLFDDEKKDDEKKDDDDDDEKKDDDDDDDDEKKDDDDEKKHDEKKEDDEHNKEEFDTEKLRAYEKSKLRYYYAVVECDSIATADYIYKACDGIEFERSSNVLDLRFIPDSMEFQHPPRDVAKEVPADYEGLDFHTRSLQHSNVLLSWDDDDPHRAKKLRQKFNDKQLDELEWKDFLASDESDSDEAENIDEDLSGEKKKKVDKYRALIQSGDGSEEEDNEGQDMEVTFNSGLEEISKKILEKKDKKSETVWEAYLRKRKEKKANKKRSKKSSDDDSDDSDEERPEQPDDFFEEEITGESSKKTGHGKKKRDEKKTLLDKAAEASRAELELLLADEKGTESNVKGYKIKQKKAKGKKGKEAPDEDKLPTVANDPRFSDLLSKPDFAVDPTDPQFKRSANYFRQLSQQQQKGREEPSELSREPSNGSTKEDNKCPVDTSQQAARRELSATVKSMRMKSQNIKMEANGSTFKEKKKHKLPSSDNPTKKKAKV